MRTIKPCDPWRLAIWRPNEYVQDRGISFEIKTPRLRKQNAVQLTTKLLSSLLENTK